MKKVQRKEHAHDVFHIVLYIRGEGIFNYNGCEVPFEPGMLALTGPGDGHMFGAYEPDEETVEYRSFTFDMVDSDGKAVVLPFSDLLSQWWNVPVNNLDLTPRVLNSTEMRDVLSALDAAISLSVARESFPVASEVPVVLSLLAAILKVSGRNNDGKKDKVDRRLLKAVTILDRDMTAKFDLKELARAAGMSRAHFLRCFKAEFGETPMCRSRRRRLECSRKMLENRETTFKEIAEATGFCDEFHFSKSFKAQFHETPSEFRRRFESYRV